MRYIHFPSSDIFGSLSLFSEPLGEENKSKNITTRKIYLYIVLYEKHAITSLSLQQKILLSYSYRKMNTQGRMFQNCFKCFVKHHSVTHFNVIDFLMTNAFITSISCIYTFKCFL